MNNPETVAHAPGLTLADIYYALFRHKWKIVICTVAGLAGAAAVYKFYPPPAESEAKLFVRYVITENAKLGPTADDEKAKSPDQRGETIMNSELEILKSLDLAKQVALVVGPEKILAKSGGGKDVDRAAAMIERNLIVGLPPRSSVIDIIFRHRDPAVVQPVLTAVIDQYLKMHLAIHRAVGIVGDFLTQETDQLRSRLAQTEDDLRKARNKAGVISIDDSKKAFGDQISRIRQQIFDAQAELAEHAAILQQLGKELPAASASGANADTPVPPAQIDAYRGVSGRLDLLQKREQDLLTQFTTENALVKEVRSQITAAEAEKRKIETAYPSLLRLSVAPDAQAAAKPGAIDPAAEMSRIAALQAKIKVLNAQLDEVRTEATTADQMEVTIMELRRRLQLEEENYKYYASSLEQARVDEALGPNRVSNISTIQDPSPPFVDWAKAFKLMGMLAAGGLTAGLAWAFSIELYFDRSVRRPIDIERMIRVPLFLSIPDLGSNGHQRLGPGPARLSLPAPGPGSPPPAKGAPGTNPTTALATKNGGIPELYPFYETLRDRLLGYFESINLTHKPKLVAVTGLGKDAGVTTIAAGLAQCCSETGEGNVLLVDMTPGQGSAQQFYRGKAVCGLDEILQTKDNAQVQDNLYVVTEGSSSEQLSRVLPKRFNELVPKLKASDFDYIIFDMPPVNQISITPRLAGFMDMVLLTVESEKTDRAVVQRATALLEKTKTHVGVVLNKTKSYVPRSLHQGFILDS